MKAIYRMARARPSELRQQKQNLSLARVNPVLSAKKERSEFLADGRRATASDHFSFRSV